MKVMITETTVVSYEVDVALATSALQAARLARAAFHQALDPTQFGHSVVQNSLEYTLLGPETPQSFVDDELDS